MAAQEALTIGEVAQRTGLAASTLRYWERLGVLPAPPRTFGQRRYRPDTLEHIALIEVGKRAGFALAEIRVLLEGLSDSAPPSRVWAELARHKLPEIERQLAETQAIKRMLEHGLECQCLTLQQCLRWVGPSGPT